jgi:hypothetical protein
MFRTFFGVALIFVFGTALVAFGSSGLPTKTDTEKRLQEVRKVYVGEVGKGDEAARFRLLLQDELSKKGFTVVDCADTADGVLTGVLSVRVMDDKSQARAYMTLATPSGERLWAKDFGERIFTNPFKHVEPVKLRAQDVAKGLSEDAKK